MKDLLKIIFLLAVIFASASVCIWYGIGSPTYLSAKVVCDVKDQPATAATGLQSTQIKLFGFDCQK